MVLKGTSCHRPLGANGPTGKKFSQSPGGPPLAWGKRGEVSGVAPVGGWIPTRVGQTNTRDARCTCTPVDPHSRGANLDQPLLGTLQDEPQPVQIVQATAAAQADAESLRDKLMDHLPLEPAEGSSWPVRCQPWQAVPAPPPSTPPAASRMGRGGADKGM